MPDIQEQLRSAQARVKTLAGRRDQINREVGVEEQKLAQIFENLRQLGVDGPEGKSTEELQGLADQTQAELEEGLKRLAESLSQGEALLTEYDRLQ